jgi:hypothetical protein
VRENEPRWRQLCEQAAVEQDSPKLLELIKEINDLLEAKRKRLQNQVQSNDAAEEECARPQPDVILNPRKEHGC